MSNLTVTAADVRLVRGDAEDLLTAPMGEAGTGGQYFRLNTTTGKLEKGNGSSAGEVGSTNGVLLDSVSTVGMPGTIALCGSNAILDMGEALASLAFDAAVYASDTDATLADSAGTVSKVVGRVAPGWNNPTADKLLMLR